MGKESNIGWTNHTFNPWWGCTRVSPACKYCYADTWARRFGLELWNHDSERRFFSDRHWAEPLKWNKEAIASGTRARVFAASMSDVFEDRRELDSQRERLWGLIEATPQLDWLLLTKRIDQVRTLVPWRGRWPTNIWLGTTAENQEWLDSRIDHLLENDATLRFLSAEPLLGPLNVARWLRSDPRAGGLNWVIAGGESGFDARLMNPTWPGQLRDQCLIAGVPFYFKQWGTWAPEHTIYANVKILSDRKTVDVGGRQIQMLRVGKLKAGRELDGLLWDQIPSPMISSEIR